MSYLRATGLRQPTGILRIDKSHTKLTHNLASLQDINRCGGQLQRTTQFDNEEFAVKFVQSG